MKGFNETSLHFGNAWPPFPSLQILRYNLSHRLEDPESGVGGERALREVVALCRAARLRATSIESTDAGYGETMMVSTKRNGANGRTSGRTARSGIANGRGVSTVGRKREGQPKAVQRTYAGKLGLQLEFLMNEAKLTPAELAERSGLSPDMIRKCLRGDRIIDIDRWPDVAKALRRKNVRDLMPDIAVD